MELTSVTPDFSGRAPNLRLLQEVPGITDVVWAIRARVDPYRDPARLVFLSAEPRAGNTVIAAATAIALARHLRVPVCLVETNVERPALASYLCLKPAGVSDLLDGRAILGSCIQPAANCPNLFVLPAGTARKPVSGEFSTEAMRAILAEAGKRGRYLILDAPPVLDHLESRLLLQGTDGAVLVLRAGSTRIDAASRAQRILVEARAPILGSVFNAYGQIRGGGTAYAYPDFEKEAGPVPQMLLPDTPDAEDEFLRSASGAGSALPPTDGMPRSDGLPLPDGMISAAEHRAEVELLERRIAKLTAMLEQTEADLRRLAVMKNVDLGIASIYRGVQGLSPEEAALALKTSLMQKIFEANLELKEAMDRRSNDDGTSFARRFKPPH